MGKKAPYAMSKALRKGIGTYYTSPQLVDGLPGTVVQICKVLIKSAVANSKSRKEAS